MLEGLVSHVIGVDTHKATHTAAVVEATTGGALEIETVPATRAGYEALVDLADGHGAAGERAWAIEGTGSYGAGLAAFLEARGEWVIELDRPSRPGRRNGAKSDAIDAVRAAREALGRRHWAQPRARGAREALRVLVTTREGAVRDRTRAINQLKAMLISAPEELRERLGIKGGVGLVRACARLRDVPARSAEHRATVAAVRRLAQRIAHLEAEIAAHERDIAALTRQVSCGTACQVPLAACFGLIRGASNRRFDMVFGLVVAPGGLMMFPVRVGIGWGSRDAPALRGSGDRHSHVRGSGPQLGGAQGVAPGCARS